ncbi:hypothetical protein [Croceicoccus naphthovorans]|uniref:Uncharacterized protein n=1 Tax=Croceicoccus naphthovorans TaxID=1348774 RepID=A0A0G3XE49_9SPHN|nr:hypothetical protein [Croceicoccus naphthovorans]AKM08879.1 hypothetical protein AB433_01000 [Croceicoccus naphthovorans]MBB3989362.1 dipeptide/tripeptide permease [Croceicoccus naphthovorans]
MIRKRMIAADRKLGRFWARVCGTVFLMIGLFALISLIDSQGFSVTTHWPGLAIAGLFFLAAVGCFRSRAGLADTLSDNLPGKRR